MGVDFVTDRAQGGEVGAVRGAEPGLRVVDGGRGSLDFQQLFLDHYGFVCRALRSMAVDAASVEDLAQDVFIVFHRRMHEYDPTRDLRSWLWGIAKRVASTHARSRQRAERKLRALPDPVAREGLDDALELKQRADVVARFLHGLPDEQRQVFVLAELESRSAPEIAEAMGIKLNTVYSRLRTARERFKRAVARHQARDQRRVHA